MFKGRGMKDCFPPSQFLSKGEGMVAMQAYKATTKNPSEKYNQFGRCLPDLYSQRLAQNSMLIFAKIKRKNTFCAMLERKV